MVTVAAALDSWSSVPVTLKVKLAVPFQFATGSNTSVPRSAAGIESSALRAVSGLPDFSAPWAVSGRVTILTDFSVWPSGSLNAPVKSVAANVSVVSSLGALADVQTRWGCRRPAMVPMALAVAIVTPAGRVVPVIVTLKVSSPSVSVSCVVETVKVASVWLAVIVTLPPDTAV